MWHVYGITVKRRHLSRKAPPPVNAYVLISVASCHSGARLGWRRTGQWTPDTLVSALSRLYSQHRVKTVAIFLKEFLECLENFLVRNHATFIFPPVEGSNMAFESFVQKWKMC